MSRHKHDIVLSCMADGGVSMTDLFGKSMTDSAFETLAQDLSKASKDERAKVAAEILGGHL